MSQALEAYKADYRNENLQVFIFSEDFKLLETCQSFIKVKVEDGYMFSNFDFFKPKKKIMIALKENEERHFQAEDIVWQNKHMIVDIVAKKIEQRYIVFIEELTEAYSYSPLNENNSNEELRTEMAKIKKMQKLKSDHFAKITHDIKLPLTEIVGTTYLLGNFVESEKGKEYLKALSNASKNLDTMLNDLVSFAKSESLRLKIEDRPFAVEQIIWSVIKSFEFKTSQQNVPIFFNKHNNTPQYISGDPTRLSQIIYNLVDNALKFTKQGNIEIRIQVAELNENACRLCFEVEDTGIGIPADKLKTIFETFTQARQEDELKGFGIGLSIVKQLIELQGGKIIAKSEIGKGTCFSFELPFEIAKELKQS